MNPRSFTTETPHLVDFLLASPNLRQLVNTPRHTCAIINGASASFNLSCFTYENQMKFVGSAVSRAPRPLQSRATGSVFSREEKRPKERNFDQRGGRRWAEEGGGPRSSQESRLPRAFSFFFTPFVRSVCSNRAFEPTVRSARLRWHSTSKNEHPVSTSSCSLLLFFAPLLPVSPFLSRFVHLFLGRLR